MTWYSTACKTATTPWTRLVRVGLLVKQLCVLYSCRANPHFAGSLPLPEYQGSPEDVFDDLPEGVRIEVTNQRASEGSVGSCVDESSGSFIVKLNKLPSHKLVLFPETAEGHVSQVRWYSFQFLLEELAEQMQDTVDAFDRLLERIQDVEHDEDGWVWM